MKKEYEKMIVITAPSGSGKTSITRHLIKVFPQLTFSISVATRKPRTDEVDGVDYYFIYIKNLNFLNFNFYIF